MKQARALRGRHPDARVADLKPQRHCSLRPSDRRLLQPDAHHHLALLGELDGVAHQVGENLPQPSGVAPQSRRDGGLHQCAQFQALGVGPFRQQHAHIFHQGPEIEVDDLQLHFPGFDLREVQDLADEVQQMLAGAAHGVRVVPLLRRQVRIEQQPRHADHSVHRRADLVTHGR